MTRDESVDYIEITLVASTDIHGRYLPWNYALDEADFSGSLTQMSTLLKEIRAENPHTLLLEVGDLIQDNSAGLFKDEDSHPAMIALNEMDYDVWTVGNHEFDYGFESLDKIVAQFDGDFLGGNVYNFDSTAYYPAYTIIERAGVKIAIIGMTSPLVADFNEGKDIFSGKEVRNPVTETKKIVGKLEGKVDALIGLMHMGIKNENNEPDTGVADLVRAVPELDAVFTGHMHSLRNEEINDVLVLQANHYGSHLARLDLTFEEQNGHFELVDKKAKNISVEPYASDQELEELLMPSHEIARTDANMVLGELVGMDLVPKDEIKGIPQVQIQETALTNFFSEVMLHYSDADIVAHQIDTDFARLDKGPIRKKDLAHNYQYVNGEVSVYQLTGKDLKDYMEWSAAYFNQTKTGDVTISFDPERRASKYSSHDIFGGVKYTINLKNAVGHRIENLFYSNGQAVKARDKIKLGMNSYRMEALVSEGGPLDGRNLQALSSSQSEEAFGEIEGRIRNLAARYLKEEMNGVYEAYLNHHWEIIGIERDQPAREAVINLVNSGILTVPSNEEGRTNIASINVLEKVSSEEIRELTVKADVEESLFTDIQTKAKFYLKLDKEIKLMD